jgi:peptidoglycan LD-endopeptidase CwlK
VDIWIVEDDGSVSFDAKKLTEVAKAMKQAAKELGVGIQWGGDWTSFVDRPHFELT